LAVVEDPVVALFVGDDEERVRLVLLGEAEGEAHFGKRDACMRELRALLERVVLAVAGLGEPDALPEVGLAIELQVGRVRVRVHPRIDFLHEVDAAHVRHPSSSGWRSQYAAQP
jgi:hypothetical protein